MRMLKWRPSVDLRVKMVAPLFPSVDQDDLAALVAEYHERPVSFWADVRSSIVESTFNSTLQCIGEAEIHRILQTGSRIRLASQVVTFTDVKRATEQLASLDMRRDDYLGPEAN